MNNNLDMINSLTLPTFVAGKEVKAIQLNTVVDVFKTAIEVLRDRVDYIKGYDGGADYAEEGDIADTIGATYKLLNKVRDTASALTSLSSSFTAYTIATDARIGNWASIYKGSITNVVDALNDLNTSISNNTSSIININSLLDGITVGVIEDLKQDIDILQQEYVSEAEVDIKVANLAGAGRTTETIKGLADQLANLNIDLQSAVSNFMNKADLVNGKVPASQLPDSIRVSNKGRYASLAALELAWPDGSADLNAGDFAFVDDGSYGEFYSYDATSQTWESSGFSGTVTKVNNISPDTFGNVTLDTDDIAEGTNKYYTEARVAANSAVAANTAKRSYPSADQTKLAGIASGATVGANWNTNLSNIPSDLVHTSDLTNYVLASSLATVATTGSYTNLINKPTIATLVSQLTNDSGFITNATSSLTNYYPKGTIDSYLGNKVDKISGKGLSTEDYTTVEKVKLGGIEAGAQVNAGNTTLQGNTFNGVNQLVKLDSLGRLPELDGRHLINLDYSDFIPLTTLGDLMVHNGTNLVRLPSGATSQILTVDPTTASGLKWIDNAANSGPTTFLGLSDTPNTYIGNAGDFVRVAQNESQLEFVELQESISGSFTNANLTASVLTVPHTQGNVVMPYIITDESNNVMIPNEVNFGDGVITVTLTDFTPITGTWHYVFGSRSMAATGITDKTININGVSSDTSGNITITAADVDAMPDTTFIPTTLADLTSDSTHRLVTDTEKNTWNNKLDALPTASTTVLGGVKTSEFIGLNANNELAPNILNYVWDGASSTTNPSNLTLFQRVYDTILLGNKVNIYTASDGANFSLELKFINSTSVVFESAVNSGTVSNYSSVTGIAVSLRRLTLTKSGNTITQNTALVTVNIETQQVLGTNINYGTPYTPLYNGSPATKKYVDDGLATKQNTLTSGSSIKTINEQSLLGSGNINIPSPTTITVYLQYASWVGTEYPYTQTITVNGVTSSNTVIISPAPNSINYYSEFEVYCSAQGTNSLTFTSSTLPNVQLTINVVII